MDKFLVVAYALLAGVLVYMVLEKWGHEDDVLSRRKKNISGKGNKQEVIEELNLTFFDRFVKPIITKMTEGVAKASGKENRAGKRNEALQKVERQLRLAGMDMSVEEFNFYKKSIALIVILVTGFASILLMNSIGALALLIFLIGAVVGIVGPSFFLGTKASSRQEAIRIQVPDALDLLSICVEAGLSFDSSLLKVSEKIQGPFIDELLIVYREINMGVPRNDALKKLGESTEISELKTFISALIQANQLGIPINNVMNVQSVQLRETRKQQAKEKGAKAPVKMLLPMVGFIFPVLFIILMGPTVLNIMEMF